MKYLEKNYNLYQFLKYFSCNFVYLFDKFWSYFGDIEEKIRSDFKKIVEKLWKEIRNNFWEIR